MKKINLKIKLDRPGVYFFSYLSIFIFLIIGIMYFESNYFFLINEIKYSWYIPILLLAIINVFLYTNITRKLTQKTSIISHIVVSKSLIISYILFFITSKILSLYYSNTVYGNYLYFYLFFILMFLFFMFSTESMGRINSKQDIPISLFLFFQKNTHIFWMIMLIVGTISFVYETWLFIPFTIGIIILILIPMRIFLSFIEK